MPTSLHILVTLFAVNGLLLLMALHLSHAIVVRFVYAVRDLRRCIGYNLVVVVGVLQLAATANGFLIQLVQ